MLYSNAKLPRIMSLYVYTAKISVGDRFVIHQKRTPLNRVLHSLILPDQDSMEGLHHQVANCQSIRRDIDAICIVVRQFLHIPELASQIPHERNQKSARPMGAKSQILEGVME